MRHSCGKLFVFAGVTATGEQVYACTESRSHAFLPDTFFMVVDGKMQQQASVRWAKRKRLGDVELVAGAIDSDYKSPLMVRNRPTSCAAKVWDIEQRIARRVEAYRRMSLQRSAPRMPEPRWRAA